MAAYAKHLLMCVLVATLARALGADEDPIETTVTTTAAATATTTTLATITTTTDQTTTTAPAAAPGAAQGAGCCTCSRMQGSDCKDARTSHTRKKTFCTNQLTYNDCLSAGGAHWVSAGTCRWTCPRSAPQTEL
eukprot:TRINITY_DN114684_c0_g1_i1.p1 TRINITY_DN114684_c0_g1~~TRINITY_DN114684_c0_g1_i1.p1  ORF type:complete len:134 (-),score=14.82 TRINITY_DN114684_c0_g1_i1:120-521(-)